MQPASRFCARRGTGSPLKRSPCTPPKLCLVTVRVGRDGDRGIPQRPTRPSRIDTLSVIQKRDTPSAVTSLMAVENVVFFSQPCGVDVQLLCHGVRLEVDAELLTQFGRCA